MAPPPICKNAFSGESRPKTAPKNLAENPAVAVPVGKHFISLSWDGLPARELNGKLKEYIVKYKVSDVIGNAKTSWDRIKTPQQRVF